MADNENRYVDHIALSVTFTMEGRDLDSMFENAKVEAAAVFNRPIDRLYIISHTPVRPATATKFRAHLDEPSFVETWKVDVTIGVKPEGEE
jgi:hypothetical protein